MGNFNAEDIKTTLGTKEITDYKTVGRQLFAEFIGTFLLLSIILFSGTTVGQNSLAVPFASGLLFASLIQVIGPISGGHMNPAVTMGSLICGHIKILKAVLYVVAQVLGSIVGSFVAYALCDANSVGNLGATIPLNALRDEQVLGLEFLMTFLLVSVFLSVSDKYRSVVGLGSAPLAVGLSVTACQAAALNYTGSLNPIRSLGPAVVMNVWTSHWTFWAGPLLGGLIAGLVYKCLLASKERNEIIQE